MPADGGGQAGRGGPGQSAYWSESSLTGEGTRGRAGAAYLSCPGEWGVTGPGLVMTNASAAHETMRAGIQCKEPSGPWCAASPER